MTRRRFDRDHPAQLRLMTIEFARFLLGLDSMHTGHAGIHG
jgi:hypothetical protein